MRFVVLTGFLLCFSTLHATDDNEAQIEQKNKSTGLAVVQEQSTTNLAKSKEAAGQQVYERFCVVCHRDGLVGAPKVHDQAWSSRLSGRTIDDLVATAIKGLNAMPAKGTCYECSDDDMRAAVEYMLPNHD